VSDTQFAGMFEPQQLVTGSQLETEPFQAVETASQKTNYRLQHLRNQAFRMVVAGAPQVYEPCAGNALHDVLSVPARKYRIIASL
jgi:hypothetical protein